MYGVVKFWRLPVIRSAFHLHWNHEENNKTKNGCTNSSVYKFKLESYVKPNHEVQRFLSVT